jgi:hypothetical protein
LIDSMRNSGSEQLLRQQQATLKPRDGHDPDSRGLCVEFTDGPYDGHEQSWFASPTRLPVEVVWLVCEDAFRLLDGQSHRPTGVFTSVALFELEKTNAAYRCRFVRALPVNDLIDSLRGDWTFKSIAKEEPCIESNRWQDRPACPFLPHG